MGEVRTGRLWRRHSEYLLLRRLVNSQGSECEVVGSGTETSQNALFWLRNLFSAGFCLAYQHPLSHVDRPTRRISRPISAVASLAKMQDFLHCREKPYNCTILQNANVPHKCRRFRLKTSHILFKTVLKRVNWWSVLIGD